MLETKVIFSAVKTRTGNSWGNFKGPITFDNLAINLGEGFDARSGIFTVPTSGTYRFSFSAQSALGKNQFTEVYVKKNGENVLKIWDSNEAEKADANNISYTWMMNLSENDKINLDSVNYLWAHSENPVTFTGELIYI